MSKLIEKYTSFPQNKKNWLTDVVILQRKVLENLL